MDSSKATLLWVSQRKKPLPDHLLGKKEETQRRPWPTSRFPESPAGSDLLSCNPTPMPQGYFTDEIHLEKWLKLKMKQNKTENPHTITLPQSETQMYVS